MLTVTEFWELKHQIDDEVARLGWSKAKCKAFIIQRYGKITRLAMSDDELLDLLKVLKSIAYKATATPKNKTRERKLRRKRK